MPEHPDEGAPQGLTATAAAAPGDGAAPAPGVQPGPRTGPASLDLVPVLGFRNYWHPAMRSTELKRKPVHLKMLGDDLVLFRDPATGRAHALAERCPHRGSSLALGRIYYPGTLTCSYHGWTFDTGGRLVAVLSEGPDCPLVGKVRVRTYPVEERRGFVWVWMGEGPPVSLDEDLPPEFQDPSTAIFTDVQVWRANWRVVTENTDGYHAPILHRHSLPRTLYMDWVAWRRTGVIETEDGKGVVMLALVSPEADEFPGLGRWPKLAWWERAAKKLFRARMSRGTPTTLPDGRRAFITEDLHLPGWRRVRVRRHTVFVEWAVPIDERTTRHFLWDVINTSGARGKLEAALTRLRVWGFRYLVYPVYWKWAYNRRYVGQDQWILESLKEGPERLQANDVGIIAWRKLAARARGAVG